MDLTWKFFWTFVLTAIISLSGIVVLPDEVSDWIKAILVSSFFIGMLGLIILAFVGIWTS